MIGGMINGLEKTFELMRIAMYQNKISNHDDEFPMRHDFSKIKGVWPQTSESLRQSSKESEKQ
ncbi:hypothetical protein ABTN35_20425, partial [Acinetobacter baumannii]